MDVVFFLLFIFIYFSHTSPIILTQPLDKMNLHKRSAVNSKAKQPENTDWSKVSNFSVTD